MVAREFITELASQGRYHFTTEEAVARLGVSPNAVRAQLRRLKGDGKLASPLRSFHLIIPPEYRRLGCLPAEQFIDQLMGVLEEPYYVGLLSAAERHGAAHQRPQSFQVMLRTNRRAVACGQVRIEFIARRDLERMPTLQINAQRGYIRYATPEVTALELVGYPDHAGGLNNVATVLSELAEVLDPGKLVQAAELSPLAWAQRLGFLLGLVGKEGVTQELAEFVGIHARSNARLRRAKEGAPTTLNRKWMLLINAEVDPDQ
jgi:predicted transcriptional regulator of viral defense system